MPAVTHELRLTMDLVPTPLFRISLYNLLPRAQWDKIRKPVYALQGYKCAVCGARGVLYCHEVWDRDDEKHVQTLVGLTALCELCHRVKHYGLTKNLAGQGKVDIHAVDQHFLEVNRCDYETLAAHEAEAFSEHGRRSEHGWTIDFGKYESLVPETVPRSYSPRTLSRSLEDAMWEDVGPRDE